MRDRERPSKYHNLPELQKDPASVSWPLVILVAFLIGLGVWQFASLAPKDHGFPSDRVDMSIRGSDIVVFNPTPELVDVFTVSVLRLSGTYSYTSRNLKPRSSKKVALKKLRKTNGAKYNPAEEGECRIRLEFWRGRDKDELSRYCRGF